MRRLTIVAVALTFLLIGLYFMVKMYFGGVHLSIYTPSTSMFEPAPRQIVPQYPSPGPSTFPKVRLFGPQRPAPLVKSSPIVVPGPPLPAAYVASHIDMPTPTPTPFAAPTFAPVTPPPLHGVQMPVGMRTPAPSPPAVQDVNSGDSSPSPAPHPSPS